MVLFLRKTKLDCAIKATLKNAERVAIVDTLRSKWVSVKNADPLRFTT
jgi:hypothetical protein